MLFPAYPLPIHHDGSTRYVSSAAPRLGDSRVGWLVDPDGEGADGAEGYFMLDAFVYERAGQPCRACGGAIARIVQGQRATYYCRRCQRR